MLRISSTTVPEPEAEYIFYMYNVPNMVKVKNDTRTCANGQEEFFKCSILRK